ncbi:MAG TPA: hypothetical protein DCY88_31575 [Cyanobacteria bacterium UBA11372]|nr:hypothetical protein [Cyanobacteria bacterium UBA11372]
MAPKFNLETGFLAAKKPGFFATMAPKFNLETGFLAPISPSLATIFNRNPVSLPQWHPSSTKFNRLKLGANRGCSTIGSKYG